MTSLYKIMEEIKNLTREDKRELSKWLDGLVSKENTEAMRMAIKRV